METRLATLADAPILAALHADSFGPAAWGHQQIIDSLTLPTTQSWVALIGGSVQGFLMLQTVVDEAEILTFGVAPAAQRKGLGAKLLDAALAAARGNGIRRVYLEVATDNQGATGLYEKAGFRITGRRFDYYARADGRIDAVTYSLDLE